MLEAITFVHVFFGAVAFVSAAGAIGAKTLYKDQRLHNIAGRTFTIAMLGIFLSALLIVSFTFNLFLILIAVFSIYLALSGYLIARNRQPVATSPQKLLSGAAALVGAGKLAFGLVLTMNSDGLGTVLIAFGAIMVLLAAEEIWHWVAQDLRGSLRIALHLSRMLGGTIAILTASAVVNLELEPQWLPWLLPTIVIAPLIVGWNVRLRRAVKAPARTGAQAA